MSIYYLVLHGKQQWSIKFGKKINISVGKENNNQQLKFELQEKQK